MAWPRVSKKGFILPGDGPQLLLLHGYTGSPYDLRLFGDYFHKRGFYVSAPLLKGHGLKPSHLHQILSADWLNEARDILKGFDQKKPIIIGGLSMGALMGIVLATEGIKVDALVLCSPALRLSFMAEMTLLSVRLGFLDKNISIKKYSGSDIADPAAKAKTPAYNELPLSGLVQFADIRALAEDKLSDVACPVFLAIGRKDQAVDALASRQMILQASTKAKIFSKTYENSKHVITLDYDKDKLFLDIEQFLHHQLGI